MDLRPPPPHPHKQKPPVVEELRGLAFESVADELEHPSDQEQSEPVQPQSVEEDAGHKNRKRKQNGRNAQRVAQAVHRMLMTGTVLRDPLLVGAFAQHARDDITIRAANSARHIDNTRAIAPPKHYTANRA